MIKRSLAYDLKNNRCENSAVVMEGLQPLRHDE